MPPSPPPGRCTASTARQTNSLSHSSPPAAQSHSAPTATPTPSVLQPDRSYFKSKSRSPATLNRKPSLATINTWTRSPPSPRSSPQPPPTPSPATASPGSTPPSATPPPPSLNSPPS